MKYFIDFEATEFSGEIISIGCVDENGREFYTVVKPHKPDNLTDFITKLTGITAQDLEAAPTANKAFSAFFAWLDKSSVAEFYSYGNTDELFVRRTLKHVTDFYAQSCLSLIKSNLSDFAKDVNAHFSIVRDIALIKLISYYRGEEVQQSHNALEDAKFLHEAYLRMQDEVVTECPFPDHQKKIQQETVKEIKPVTVETWKLEAIQNDTVVQFASYKFAVNWLMEKGVFGQQLITDKTRNHICNNIRRAATRGTRYCGLRWKLHK